MAWCGWTYSFIHYWAYYDSDSLLLFHLSPFDAIDKGIFNQFPPTVLIIFPLFVTVEQLLTHKQQRPGAPLFFFPPTGVQGIVAESDGFNAIDFLLNKISLRLGDNFK